MWHTMSVLNSGMGSNETCEETVDEIVYMAVDRAVYAAVHTEVDAILYMALDLSLHRAMDRAARMPVQEGHLHPALPDLQAVSWATV